MILRLFEQDVQTSGIKTGSLVSTALRNHAAVRVSAGHDLRVSFDVQDARMSRVHGCTGATFWVLFFVQTKEKYFALKSETIAKPMTKS